jgi:hypothetical protein
MPKKETLAYFAHLRSLGFVPQYESATAPDGRGEDGACAHPGTPGRDVAPSVVRHHPGR